MSLAELECARIAFAGIGTNHLPFQEWMRLNCPDRLVRTDDWNALSREMADVVAVDWELPDRRQAIPVLLSRGVSVVLSRTENLTTSEWDDYQAVSQKNQTVVSLASPCAGDVASYKARSVLQKNLIGSLQFASRTNEFLMVPRARTRPLEELVWPTCYELGFWNLAPLQTVVNLRQSDRLAVGFTFENGAQVWYSASRAALCSAIDGWLIEGSTGTYRGDRLFRQTDDEEIVDTSIADDDLPTIPEPLRWSQVWRDSESWREEMTGVRRGLILYDAVRESLRMTPARFDSSVR